MLGLASTLGGGAPPPPPNLAATADSATAVVAAAKAELPDFPSLDGLQRSLPVIARARAQGGAARVLQLRTSEQTPADKPAVAARGDTPADKPAVVVQGEMPAGDARSLQRLLRGRMARRGGGRRDSR